MSSRALTPQTAGRPPLSRMADVGPGPIPSGGMRPPAGVTIPLTVVDQRRLETYQIFILASLAFALGAGFLLAVVLPLGRALGWGIERERPDLIASHGQAQVLGFAGLFVLGMALRLMPRFSGVHLRHDGLVMPALVLFAGGLVARVAIGPMIPDAAQALLVSAAQAALMAASLMFALVILGTLTQKGSRADATGYMFAVGACALALQGLLAALLAVDQAGEPIRVFFYLPNAALLHLQLAGFLVAFIAGVSTRALPTMAGSPRPIRSVKLLAPLLAVSVSMTAGAFLWAEYGDYSATVARLSAAGFVGLGVVLLTVAWLTGVLRPGPNRLRPASQPHLWLVRVGVTGMAFSGLLALYIGGRGLAEGVIVSFFHLDALRHAIGLGVVTPLIMGMAMMILPEFAGERMGGSRQGVVSMWLAAMVATAAVLRMAPALAGLSWSADLRAWSMAVAGVLVMAAVGVFAASFVRLLLASRRPALRRPS